MINILLSDFSRVLLFPADKEYTEGLNLLNKKLINKLGADYRFFEYFKLNDELLNIYGRLKTHCPVYIFTSDTIQNRAEVRNIIDSVVSGIFSASEYGINKKDPDAYTLLVHKLNRKPDEILYVDDQLENIQAAKKAGLSTALYLNNPDIRYKLNKYFPHI